MDTTTIDISQAAIYVGTYAKYNEGNLFGEWVLLSNYADRDEFYAYCRDLHKDEEDAEFMFQDFEHIPRSLVSEMHIDKKVWDILALYNQDANKAERVMGVMDHYSMDLSDAISHYDQNYQGEWDSDEKFAGEMFEECYSELSDIAQTYWDWEKWTRDVMMDYTEIDGHYYRD